MENVHVQLILLIKEIKYVYLVVNHFIGINNQNNVNNAQLLLFMINLLINVYVHYQRHIYIMEDVSDVINLISGIKMQNNVNGVHKHLFIRN